MVTRDNKKEYFKYKGEKVTIPTDLGRINIPELSEWRVYLVEGLFYIPTKGTEPNKFHRFMHRILLGFKWVKNND